MVHDALHHLDLAPLDIVFIENVGNLVCPASFDLGHHLNVTLLSSTEGDDKPAKYPVMFRAADLMLITKSDLLSVLDDFDPQQAEHYLRQLASEAPVFQVSARKQPQIDDWIAWLHDQVAIQRDKVAQHKTQQPKIQPDGQHLHSPSSPHHHDHVHE
jgi:hydrogenase nickel incorporation protein HypB